jgi:hypothetical protein
MSEAAIPENLREQIAQTSTALEAACQSLKALNRRVALLDNDDVSETGKTLLGDILMAGYGIGQAGEALNKYLFPWQDVEYTDFSGTTWRIWFNPCHSDLRVEPTNVRYEKIPDGLFVELGNRFHNSIINDESEPLRSSEVIAIIDKWVPSFYVDSLKNPWKIWRTDDCEKWQVKLHFPIAPVPQELLREISHREIGSPHYTEEWFETREEAIAFIERFIPKKESVAGSQV